MLALQGCFSFPPLTGVIVSIPRADCRFAPSLWETALLFNDVSHWLGAGLESTLVPQCLWSKSEGYGWKLWNLEWTVSILQRLSKQFHVLQSQGCYFLKSSLRIVIDIYRLSSSSERQNGTGTVTVISITTRTICDKLLLRISNLHEWMAPIPFHDGTKWLFIQQTLP